MGLIKKKKTNKKEPTKKKLELMKQDHCILPNEERLI